MTAAMEAHPWLDLVCGTTGSNGLLGDVRSQLVHPTARDHQLARGLGFVNAEHEALSFLASPWYFDLMEDCLACCTYVPGMWDPEEIGQVMLDQAYDGELRMATREEVLKAGPPLRRPGAKPRDGRWYDYSVARASGHTHILEVIDAYAEIIRWEFIEKFKRVANVEEEQMTMDSLVFATAIASTS